MRRRVKSGRCRSLFYENKQIIAAWCTLREAFRHFRTERIVGAQLTEVRYGRRRVALADDWHAQWQEAQRHGGSTVVRHQASKRPDRYWPSHPAGRERNRLPPIQQVSPGRFRAFARSGGLFVRCGAPSPPGTVNPAAVRRRCSAVARRSRPVHTKSERKIRQWPPLPRTDAVLSKRTVKRSAAISAATSIARSDLAPFEPCKPMGHKDRCRRSAG